MERRTFLNLMAASPLFAQKGPPREERVEKMTAPASQTIALCHLGFLPKSRKTLVVRNPGPAAEFLLRDIGGYGGFKPVTRPLKPLKSDFGSHAIGDFSDIEREGMYQITVGGERSVPFFLRPDLWSRTLPKAVSYIHAQRCGTAVANVHPVCHLDDAKRRDNGEYVDVSGGWHDAGDLRKWMSATMMNGFGLMHLQRNLGDKWNEDGSGAAVLLDEMKWGNRYFLKMQAPDGRVWADAAGGLNGDNSDNHWTDNRAGTPDDRYINTSHNGRIQAMFCCLQALVAQGAKTLDPGYGQVCLAAGLRCWKANTPGGNAQDLSWWALAALELYRATSREEFRTAAEGLGRKLLSLQVREHEGNQKLVRGYWRTSEQDRSPYVAATDSALPPLAIFELKDLIPEARDAVKMHIEEYVLPMTTRSPYQIVPYGLFQGSPTPERYRPLAGDLTYRYFLPVRKQFWWLGTTSHLECYAMLLAKMGYKDLAIRQLEWVMGGNPFGACLMTGEGMRNPYPHSRYVGLIVGGILNGIAGNVDDEPVLDTQYGYDWRTTEYWSPHNAYYLWAVSSLV